MLKQLLDALVEVFDVLVRIVRERITGTGSPYELLRFCVEQIDHQRPNLICVCCSSRLSKTSPSKTSPTPASSKPVVEGIKGLLQLRHLYCDDRNIAAGIHLGPTLCRQGGVHSVLDSIDIEGVFRLYGLPTICLVLTEVCPRS